MKTIEELEKELEEVEDEIFLNQMIDDWHLENFNLDDKLNKRKRELKQEIEMLKGGNND